jgi:cytochrome c-type biogenesis protein CcmH
VTGFWIGVALLGAIMLLLMLRRRGGVLAALVAIAALGAALWLHYVVSNWRPAVQSPAEQQARAEIRALQSASRARPTDAAAWLSLGQKYLQYEQFRLAEISLTTANRLYNGRNAAALAALAEALAIDDDASNDARVAPLFAAVLQLEPNNAKALFYLGLKAMHDGQLQQARDYFKAMLGPGVPPDVMAALQRQITAIDAALAADRGKAPTGPGKPPTSAGAENAGTAVNVSVELAPARRAAFEAKAKAGAILFIFARNPAGGPPLAAKRMPATLPVRISLSAADAMIAGNAIQPRQRIAIVARLSSGGSPTMSSGDLYGEAQAVAGSAGNVAIVIDKVAP